MLKPLAQKGPMTTISHNTTSDITTRRLATIELISELSPIKGADAIVCARVRGWDVVVKKDEFKVSDLCVYIEVDTMLDVNDERFAFLSSRGQRTDHVTGRRGHVLKTIRLRGQYSQGLAFSLAHFPELGDGDADRVGEDVTELLGVTKWEPPLSAELAGEARGPRPSWIHKTDEERIQNLPNILTARDLDWIATEKIDGSSVSFWVDGVDEGVCSRNFDLLETESNTIWRLARQLDIFAKLRAANVGDQAAIQGEAYGEGIQSNPLKVRGHHFDAFTLLGEDGVVPRTNWPTWAHEISVPTHDLPFPTNLEEALTQVDSLASALNPKRTAEGVVWRSTKAKTVELEDGVTSASFKVISNRYLLKHDR